LTQNELSVGNNLTSNQSNPAGPKPPFVKPELICHGAVVDLTSHFGGSFTPTDDSD
jgi:hypothetical protein